MDNSKSEKLEIWDWEKGIPTGKSCFRDIAHKQGIPHEGVHLWIIRNINNVEIIFQKRAPHKQSYPNYLDITVGGHVPFGLKDNKIQKEAFEEIGINPSNDELFNLGYYKYEEITEYMVHREFQNVFLMLSNNPLTHYKFNDNEVTAIYAVPYNYLKDIFKNDYPIEVEMFDGDNIRYEIISKKDFHPLLFAPSMDYYMKKLFEAIDQIIKGNELTVSIKNY